MSLELDFLTELAKRPDTEASTASIARALGWKEQFDTPSYGTDLAYMVAVILSNRGIVERRKDHSSGRWHVRMNRVETP